MITMATSPSNWPLRVVHWTVHVCIAISQQPLYLCSDPRRLGRRELVVHTVQEAYDIVGVRPEDFTECLIWPC